MFLLYLQNFKSKAMQEKINPADVLMSFRSGFVIYNPSNKRTWIKESGEHIEIDISPKPQPKQ